MRRLSDKVSVVAVNEKVTTSDLAAIEARIPDYDLIVVAGYYNYRMRCSIQETLERISAFGKPMLMVSNTPYEKFGVPGEYGNVLVTFCAAGREHVRTVAEILYGKREATAKLDIPTR
jgi:beta-N-acetylhexosaminidase